MTKLAYSGLLVTGVGDSFLDCDDAGEDEDVIEYDEDDDGEGGVLLCNCFLNLSVSNSVLVKDGGGIRDFLLILVFCVGDDTRRCVVFGV